MSTKLRKIVLIAIIALSAFVRFYRLEEIPIGFHQDEVSQAYNSFSILRTGRDRYSEFLPILFRSFGSYQPPVYTYITPVFILLFGNTIFTARATSAFFGVLTVYLTYLIVSQIAKPKVGYQLSLFASLAVGISPWAIHFSRRVVEGNLGLFFFLLSFYLFLRSLKEIKFFLPAALSLGIATQAYYSERVIALLFLPIFLVYFRQHFLKYKRSVLLGLFVFGITLIPHAVTFASGAFARRFDQVSYFGTGASVFREFAIHFLSYLSPRNLFSDLGSDLGRVSPGLGVFYSLMFVPFLLGLYFTAKVVKPQFARIILPLVVIFLVPVSLTGDVFYPLRALEFFWVLSFIISVGLMKLNWRITIALSLYFLFTFYVSYFVLFKHETVENVGGTYIQLSEKLREFNDYTVVVDSTRDPAAGLRLAYFRAYDPAALQKQLRPQLTSPYYSGEVGLEEVYQIDNIIFRPISWGSDRCLKKGILVGDNLAFSPQQISEHNLEVVFRLTSSNKDFVLTGYKTHPDNGCLNN